MDKKALHKISYGLYVVSSKKKGNFNGQIANTVFQVCSEPPVIAVCINKENLTHEYIGGSKIFTVSVLSQDTPIEFIGLFGFKSGKDNDKFKNIQYKIGTTGGPIVLENTVAYLEAEVISKADVITHTVFFGKLVEGEILNEQQPMTYDYYHKVKRGKVPKNAPTYIGE